jgi:hypothetical protein
MTDGSLTGHEGDGEGVGELHEQRDAEGGASLRRVRLAGVPRDAGGTQLGRER